MSTVVDDPVVDPPEISDEEILSRCREIEAQRRAMLAHFEAIEFHRDWTAAKALFGDDVSADKLLRTATQRRYGAFQELLRHVTLPKMVDPDLQDGQVTDADDVAVADARQRFRRRPGCSPVPSATRC